MKAPWFEYYAPATLDEALKMLGDADLDGRVLAGGQSLMPMLNLRVADPAMLVDINGIPGLDGIEENADTLSVGALVRHADILNSPAVRARWPLLAEAVTQVAHPAIRNRGTVCGSVAHNDPAAEAPSILATLDGTVIIASAEGRRELPAEEFSQGMLSTALEPGEMVVGLRYRRPPEGTGSGFVEFARRLGDFAIAGAAALLTMRDGVCERARLTILGMGDGPVRACEAEDMLTGKTLANGAAREAFEAAAAAVKAAVDPAEDVHATSGYRRHLTGVMTIRALEKALARAGGGE
ncbi:MAG: xanthine dehydrogenase family protein subunit M [Rhodobiaceae bacterium]|nr:xanthine dehydrogenase family protein subunit M [Rhodobiaceae bacterium]MCC0014562.1 xanthine dehydrogenase family protein subunit M [Rhodobiaceae bacterium]MCC0061357.1 xanthine dehydrogenase family protein subunit M [Rhodobiaceae bacterium]